MVTKTTISRPAECRSVLKTILRRILPWDFKPPEDLSRRLLATTGYYRLRTWAGARGEHVPEAHLYQPMFSPWEGLPEFEQYYGKIKDLTMVRRDSCYVLLKTLQQSLQLKGDAVECGVFRGGTALLEAMVIAGTDRNLHLFDSFEGMPETSAGSTGSTRATSPGHRPMRLRHSCGRTRLCGCTSASSRIRFTD